MRDSEQTSNSSLVFRLAVGAILFLGTFFVVGPLSQWLGLRGPYQSLLMLIPAVSTVLFSRFDRYIERARGTAGPNISLFQNRYALCILAHIALLIVANLAAQSHWFSPMAVAGLSMLPAIPLVGLIFVFGRNLAEETDEFQRMEKTQASLWATSLLLTVAMVWGVLEQRGIARHVPASAAFYIWWFGMAAAKIVQKLRG